MRVLFEILDEEWRRLKDRISRYQKEIEILPKGSISIKKRREREYAYLNYREKQTVNSKYLGEAKTKVVKEYREKIELRRKLEKGLREMRVDMKAIEKVLHARRKK